MTPSRDRQAPDFSIFSTKDVADIALQRTNTLARLPRIGSISYRLWAKGLSFPLEWESRLRRTAILNAAMRSIERDFNDIDRFISRFELETVGDIGCGHGLFDLLMYRRYQPRIWLIDIEETAEKYHHFAENGAGYASLQQARELLLNNGADPARILTCNPRKTSLPDEPFSLLFSLLSAGFHYPIKDYAAYALSVLKPGGALIFDARHDTDQQQYLGGFATVEVIKKREKSDILAAIK